jgi:hypothetical protein
MRKVSAGTIQTIVQQTGRQFYDREADVLYMNWSGCAVEFAFEGRTVIGNFKAIAGLEYNGLPTDPNVQTHWNWPWIGIYVDGAPVQKLEIGQENTSVLLFQAQGEQPETHTIRIVKLTENLKTELGIASFSMDGEIHAPKSGAKQKRIEFIGDSITCGFGNMTDERDRWFYTADEDASFAHGPMAAEKLGMDYSVISISGICATQNAGIPMEYAMDELYLYTDRVIQDKLAGTGLQSAEKTESAMQYETYDFEKNHNDYVVLNLGTNDACGISLSEDPAAVYENFKKGYRSLIEAIRNANGEDTYIICALGTMNYYLWSEIKEIVGEYKQTFGDEKISAFRYMQIAPTDGFGACAHPSLITQTKMADEIAAEISRIEQMMTK